MIVRNCAGGIVFRGDKVLLVCNDKHEWCFPKGVIRSSEKGKITDLVTKRIKEETGITAKVLAPCGKTNYEFYSISRNKPVHNNISWFVMAAQDGNIVITPETGTVGAKFEPVEKALVQITYSQDKALLMMAYQKYRELA
ncbi:MAG: NUDIX domain-containing protein [Clostridiales bacterium]|nr:NUDIX domain-containing protein [Clostridiales bacterium]